MPEADPSYTIIFKNPVYPDSQQTAGYKNIRIVVIPHSSAANNDNADVITTPLLLVFFIAFTFIFLFSRIKPGSRIEKMLDFLDSLAPKK